MEGLERDRDLLLALKDYAQADFAQIGRKAKIDPSTLQRPAKGKAEYRLSQRTIEKLQAAYPAFPGWSRTDNDHLPGREVGQVSPSDVVEVAGIDLNFGLGPAFMDQEIVEHQAEKMQFPREWLRQITESPPSQLYWTRGVGNSMEPTINDGDVILIDRSQCGSTFGDLYWAIAYGQTGMIKRLRPMPDGSVKIMSDNPNVPAEIAYDNELHIFGRVIAVVRRI